MKKESLRTSSQEFRESLGRDRRIRVYTALSGVQIGLAGLGEGENVLTFPAHWNVKDCLDKPALHWIRKSTPEELQQTPVGFAPQWWQHLEKHLVPQSFVYSNGTIAEPGQPLGLHGNEVRALSTWANHQQWEEKPCGSMEGIQAPSTPSPPTPE